MPAHASKPAGARGDFHDTLAGYLRELSPPSRRACHLVPLTGDIAGVGAVAAVHFMKLVQAARRGT